jgi:hypothetical protein
MKARVLNLPIVVAAVERVVADRGCRQQINGVYQGLVGGRLLRLRSLGQALGAGKKPLFVAGYRRLARISPLSVDNVFFCNKNK